MMSMQPSLPPVTAEVEKSLEALLQIIADPKGAQSHFEKIKAASKELAEQRAQLGTEIEELSKARRAHDEAERSLKPRLETLSRQEQQSKQQAEQLQKGKSELAQAQREHEQRVAAFERERKSIGSELARKTQHVDSLLAQTEQREAEATTLKHDYEQRMKELRALVR